MKFKILILVSFLLLGSTLLVAQENEKQAPYGDYIVSATIGEANNLLPALASDSASNEINNYLYNGLVKVDKDLMIVGDLAEFWTISSDGLVITFHLHKNVKWHDNTPFTAHDVLFTYNLMVNPKTPTAYGEQFKQIEKVEVIDDYTVKVTYKNTFAKALLIWGFDQMPKHLLEGKEIINNPLSRNPIGTGAYKFETWVSGQRLVLKANEDYFEGRPNIEKIIVRVMPDQSAQRMEMGAKKIDQMSLTPDQYQDRVNDKNFVDATNFFRYPSFSYTYLGFNLKDEKFKNVKVRKAIAYAINKEELVEGVLLGLGTVANGPFKPDMWANNKNVKPYPYDLEEAKKLLQEAGWVDTNKDGYVDKNGKNFEFTILTNQGNKVREQTALILQARLAQVGIKINVRVIEWAAFLKEHLDKGNFEAIVMAWSIPIEPDLYDVWHSSKTNPGELNFVGYKNSEVDKLIDEGRFTLDLGLRKKAYDRIQEIFYEDVPYVFLYVPDALPAISNRFIGPKTSASGLGYNFNQWYVPLDRQVYKK